MYYIVIVHQVIVLMDNPPFHCVLIYIYIYIYIYILELASLQQAHPITGHVRHFS